MSERYPAGIITKNAVTPSGPYQNSTAPGIWTLDQQISWQKAGQWPTPGNLNPSLFIENLFSTYLYTGNGSTQTIANGVNLSTYGGLIWIKSRNNSTFASSPNVLTNSVTGFSNYLISSSGGVQSNWGADAPIPSTSGFSLPPNSSVPYTNYLTGSTYASWTFQKQAKFFDVVTYTGNGTSQNINHNLGTTPGFIIVKNCTSALNWATYHSAVGAGYSTPLNLTSASLSAPTVWNNTAPTSTQFTVGSAGTTNESGSTFVAYLFASNAGGFGSDGTQNVITCGTYTSSSSPTTVTLGYEPQWVMVKDSTNSSQWYMFDNMRGMSNTSSQLLQASTTSAESTLNPPAIIPTATGFIDNAQLVGAGDTMIYIAIRRGPMATPTVGTSVYLPDSGTNATSGGIVPTGFPVDMSLTAYKSQGGVAAANDRLRGYGNANSAGVTPVNYTSSIAAESTYSGSNPYFYNAWNTTITRGSNGADPTGGIITWFFQRAPGFFDEVCYTGTGSATTQAHNLGVVPELMIIKERSAANNWQVYVSSLGNTQYLVLNTTAVATTSSTRWNNTTPTSSVFSIGTDVTVNASAQTYVAYLFASLSGISKVGTFTGTGATQTINCGFTGGARFVLIKRTDTTGDWYVWDTARGMVAGTDPYLLLNSGSAAEVNANNVYTTTGGFQIVSSLAGINASGGTYIFLAIA